MKIKSEKMFGVFCLFFLFFKGLRSAFTHLAFLSGMPEVSMSSQTR